MTIHDRDLIGPHGIHRATAVGGFSRRGRARRTVGLLLGALLVLGAPLAHAAFGVSPPWVKHSAVLVGTTLAQTVTYSTNAPDEGSVFTFTESSCDAELASWMTVTLATGQELHPGDTGPWPAGEPYLPTVVHIPVPPNAALGQRHCMLMGKLCAPGVDGGGVAICLGASVLVDVTVTDQPLVAYRTVNVAPAPNRIEMGSPLRLEFEVENTGNVDVTSVQMEARVWSRKLGSPYAGPYAAEGTNSVLAPSVPAYQSSPRAKREKTFPFTSLPVGTYYLGVTTYNQDGLDYNYDYHYLEVYAPDGGVPDAAADVSAADKDGPDIGPVDVALDAARPVDGGRAAMDVGPVDTAPADVPLGGSVSADTRSDTTGLPDSSSRPSDLANVDHAIEGLPDARTADAPVVDGQADARPVDPVDAAIAPTAVDTAPAGANPADVGAATIDAASPNTATVDVGSSSIDAGQGSAASGNGCSCHLGKGHRASAATWILVVGIFALSRLARRRKEPGP